MNTFGEARSVLIVGGAGFIGRNFVKYLLSLNIEEVVVFDNFSSGSINNLKEFEDDKRLKIIEGDITDFPMDLEGCFDQIWHLAALANPTDYEKNPVETLRVNSVGNENLINIAKRNHALYIFFSSSEIYGIYNQIAPQGLSENSISHLVLNQTRSPYPIGKCFGEELTKYACQNESIPYIIVRPFNVYGPYMDMKSHYGRVIPNFISWALRHQPLQVQGDGNQIRTFCYIDDFIAALHKIVVSPSRNAIFNIGSPNPISILNLAETINKKLGNSSPIQFTDRYPFEPNMRIPNLSTIQSLGWHPEIDITRGLNRTISWFQEYRKTE